MTISNDEILNTLSNMSVMSLVELTKAMEEKWGVSAAAPVVVAAGGSGEPAAQVEEKTEFDVEMTSFGANKVGVIKVVREITGLGLKEAKDMVEAVPAIIKSGVSKEEADKIVKTLKEAGAEVAVK